MRPARHRGALATLCAVLIFLLMACTPAAPAPAPASGAPRSIAGLEGEIHLLINRHRVQARLPALLYNDQIAAIAREHSQAMARRSRPFGHAGFEERGIALSQIVAYAGLAENVAYHSRQDAGLATAVVSGWVASPGHRRNLEGAFDLTGIGAARSSEGVTYITQIFVRRR